VIYDYLIKWTDKDNNEININNILDVRVTINTASESDACEVLLPYRPYTQNGDIIFTTGEKLQVYFKNDGLIDRDNPDISDLIFTASVEDFEKQISSGTLKLICTNLTYNLLSSLFNQDVVDTPNKIVDLIVQNADPNGIDQTTVPVNIQATKSNGDPFDNVNFVSAWKTSYDCIAELSGIENTGDDQEYLFWFDPDGTFNWIYPPSDLESLEITYNSGIKDIKHTRSDVETVAMVIYNAGPDLNGVDTYGFVYNEFAENIKGAVRYYPMLDISKSLKKINYSPSDNNEFIKEQNRQATIEAQNVIKKYSGGVDKTTCILQGQKVNVAKLHTVKSPMFPQKELRLTRVVHTFNRNGWETKLELEEDVRTQ